MIVLHSPSPRNAEHRAFPWVSSVSRKISSCCLAGREWGLVVSTTHSEAVVREWSLSGKRASSVMVSVAEAEIVRRSGLVSLWPLGACFTVVVF